MWDSRRPDGMSRAAEGGYFFRRINVSHKGRRGPGRFRKREKSVCRPPVRRLAFKLGACVADSFPVFNPTFAGVRRTFSADTRDKTRT
jgi:hypothetical protein